MKRMKPEFWHIFLEEGREGDQVGGLTRCWHNIRKSGYLMMTLDYKGGGGVENLEKSDYVISERSLPM